jgi:3,4-dihydroxy 2-butanone 4-phosphate synthase/GTP cyclohydrolase II
VNLEIDLIARYMERMLAWRDETPAPKEPRMSALAPIQDIIADIKAGKMVILVDEEDRENEGDIVIAAEHITPEAINFMAKHARGLICLTLTEERCRQLGINQMARDNRSQFSTAFTVSIEAAEGVTTGISAADRARTVQAAVARHAKAADIVQPGHIFPIMAKPGGVLIRAGHTEAGCDLAGIAGLEPASVICEIMNDDGTMSRLPELIEFAATHGLKIGAIRDLIEYRARTEKLVEKVSEKTVDTPTALPPVRLQGQDLRRRAPGDGPWRIDPAVETLVRVHEPVSVLDFLDPAAAATASRRHRPGASPNTATASWCCSTAPRAARTSSPSSTPTPARPSPPRSGTRACSASAPRSSASSTSARCA